MRIALHPEGEIGTRAARILLAERGLTALGIYGRRGTATEDRRMMAISSLNGFDVLVTDADDGLSFAAIAAEDGLSCVLSCDSEPEPELAARFHSRTLLVGANLSSGLAEALARHESVRSEGPVEVITAWTQPGKPLRKGEAIPFPDPVGALWGHRLARQASDPPGTVRMVAPTDGPWAGAVARLRTRARGRTSERIVGVADHPQHLEALALAAGVCAVADGLFPDGPHRPGDSPDAYLEAALRLGLEVAAFNLGR